MRLPWLVITERQQSIVHVRAVVLIAMLAIVRKLIIFDLAGGEAVALFALAAAILSLGGVTCQLVPCQLVRALGRGRRVT
jgi:uncharacterized membrane protein (DUF373 family)